MVTGGNPGAEDASFSATSCQPGSVTPTDNDTLWLIGVAGSALTVPRAINSGFTVAFGNDGRISGSLNQATAAALNPTVSWGAGSRWAVSELVLKYGAAPSDLSGGVTSADAVASGSVVSVPSSLSGGVTADDAVATGALATQLSTVITLPFSRNPGNGARPVSIANVALAVLTDDANLARLVGSAGVLMGSNGRLTLASQVPAPPGTSVVVVTREPDGKLGVERYVLS